jgi:D-glycero-D-manno-heptose 1,7-bisphosphate phosphatase
LDFSKTIVLDRDGVINQDSENYIKSHEEWVPIPGSIEAIALLHAAGYRILVATNQSGLARGLFDEYALAKIHQKLCSVVEEAGGIISGIFYCPHSSDENCLCRKPKTGLLSQAEEEFGDSLKGSYFVGDSLRDLIAGKSFAMRPVLVRTGNGHATENELSDAKLADIPVFDDLLTATQELLTTID